jgi:hypothetical protein
MDNQVRAITISGTDVYAAGQFTSAGTCDSAAGCNYIAKWNGSSWSPIGTGVNTWVWSLAINGAGVYAGGNFISAGTCDSAAGCNYIARYGNTPTAVTLSSFRANAPAFDLVAWFKQFLGLAR